MKILTQLLLAAFVATSPALANTSANEKISNTSASEEISEADQAWLQVVEKMIAKGPATVTTPFERRVSLARDLAKKKGREFEVEKDDEKQIFKIVIR